MKKKYKLHHSEEVNVSGCPMRFAVPGGWLYFLRCSSGVAMCYVPDSDVEIEDE